MKISFDKCNVHFVVTPTDLRCGFLRLAAIASEKLNINIYEGKDVVAFISKSRGICKLIFADEKGASLLTRTLHSGKFEQMLVKRNQVGKINLTISELESFLNGEKLFEKRSNYYPRR